MPCRVGEYRPPVATGLELRLARAQVKAPFNRFRHIIGPQAQVVALWRGRVGPARPLVIFCPGEEEAGAAVTDLRVIVMGKSHVPPHDLSIELSQHRWVSALQVKHDEAR